MQQQAGVVIQQRGIDGAFSGEANVPWSEEGRRSAPKNRPQAATTNSTIAAAFPSESRTIVSRRHGMLGLWNYCG